jgi:hypothetical protein
MNSTIPNALQDLQQLTRRFIHLEFRNGRLCIWHTARMLDCAGSDLRFCGPREVDRWSIAEQLKQGIRA